MSAKNQPIPAIHAVNPRPEPVVRPSRIKASLTNIGVAAFGVMISLICFEVCYRLATEMLPNHSAAPDRPHAFYLPDSSVDNRDFYYGRGKAPGTFRIIVIGDSFTYGGKVQFDDTFSKRLERMFNLSTTGQKVEVMNWGIPGYSSQMELPLVQRALENYFPDLVLLQITLNDPELRPYRNTFEAQDKEGRIVLSNPLFSYWKSFGFVVHRYYNTLLQRDYRKYHLDLFEKPDTWNSFSTAIMTMREQAIAKHVPLVPVVFPLFSDNLDNTYPFSPVHKKLRAFFKNLQLPELDLLKDYQNIPPSRLQAVLDEDPHPNELAHRIAADSIYRFLVTKNLLPEQYRIKRVVKKRHPIHAMPSENRPLELNPSLSPAQIP